MLVWLLSLAALAAIAIAFFHRHFLFSLELGGAYFLLLGVLTIFFRLSIPAHQRQRDVCPWDKTAIKNCKLISEAKALFPQLHVAGESSNGRVWQLRCQGTYGVWELQFEDLDGQIVAYALSYRDSRSVSLDYGESRNGAKAVFLNSRG